MGTAFSRDLLSHYEILQDALSLARDNSLSVYDALFPALAKNKNAELITADQKKCSITSEMTVWLDQTLTP